MQPGAQVLIDLARPAQSSEKRLLRHILRERALSPMIRSEVAYNHAGIPLDIWAKSIGIVQLRKPQSNFKSDRWQRRRRRPFPPPAGVFRCTLFEFETADGFILLFSDDTRR